MKLSEYYKKPYAVKWIEAERELAIRGVVLPSYGNANRRLTPTSSDSDVPKSEEDKDLKND